MAATSPGEPGEFTRFMQAARLSPEPSGGSGDVAPAGPGEFTRLMQAVRPRGEAVPLKQPEAVAPAGPGEFTQLMQAVPAPAEPRRPNRRNP